MKISFTPIFSWRFILLVQLLFDVVILTDLSILRQVVGFVYLSLILGFVPIKLLDTDNLSISKFLLLSTGFSISILMFLGLVVNEILWIFGISNPLSICYLMISINCFVFGIYLFSRARDKDQLKVDDQEVSLWFALLIVLPFLSVVGSFILNHGGSNYLLLLSIVAVCIVAIISAIRLANNSSFNFGPIVLFMVAFSVFLPSSLVTNYVVGNDIYEEFYVYCMTKNRLYWDSSFTSEFTSHARVNAMLSVTLLPALYSQLLGVNGNLIFKFIYPYILSWLVIGLYELYSTQFSKKLSFLSVFFYCTNNVVFWLFSCRQIVAELFYILLFILIVDKDIKLSTKGICYLIFGASLVISHYSMAYICLLYTSPSPRD